MNAPFAGVCVFGLLPSPIVAETPPFEPLTLPESTQLSAGSAGICVTLTVCTILNVLSIRWARQARQKRLPPPERDAVWLPIMIATTRYAFVWSRRWLKPLLRFLVYVLIGGTLRLIGAIIYCSHETTAAAKLTQQTCHFARFVLVEMNKRCSRIARSEMEKLRLRWLLSQLSSSILSYEPTSTLGTRAMVAHADWLEKLAQCGDRTRDAAVYSLAQERLDTLLLVGCLQRGSVEELQAVQTQMHTDSIKAAVEYLVNTKQALAESLATALAIKKEKPIESTQIHVCLGDLSSQLAAADQHQFPKDVQAALSHFQLLREPSSDGSFKLIALTSEYSDAKATIEDLKEMIRINEVNEMVRLVDEKTAIPIHQLGIEQLIALCTTELEPMLQQATEFLIERNALLVGNDRRWALVALEMRVAEVAERVRVLEVEAMLAEVDADVSLSIASMTVSDLRRHRSDVLEPMMLRATAYLAERDALMSGDSVRPEVAALEARLTEVERRACELEVAIALQEVNESIQMARNLDGLAVEELVEFRTGQLEPLRARVHAYLDERAALLSNGKLRPEMIALDKCIVRVQAKERRLIQDQRDAMEAVQRSEVERIEAARTEEAESMLHLEDRHAEALAEESVQAQSRPMTHDGTAAETDAEEPESVLEGESPLKNVVQPTEAESVNDSGDAQGDPNDAMLAGPEAQDSVPADDPDLVEAPQMPSSAEPDTALSAVEEPRPYARGLAIPPLGGSAGGSISDSLPASSTKFVPGTLAKGRIPIFTIDLANAGSLLGARHAGSANQSGGPRPLSLITGRMSMTEQLQTISLSRPASRDARGAVMAEDPFPSGPPETEQGSTTPDSSLLHTPRTHELSETAEILSLHDESAAALTQQARYASTRPSSAAVPPEASNPLARQLSSSHQRPGTAQRCNGVLLASRPGAALRRPQTAPMEAPPPLRAARLPRLVQGRLPMEEVLRSATEFDTVTTHKIAGMRERSPQRPKTALPVSERGPVRCEPQMPASFALAVQRQPRPDDEMLNALLDESIGAGDWEAVETRRLARKAANATTTATVTVSGIAQSHSRSCLPVLSQSHSRSGLPTLASNPPSPPPSPPSSDAEEGHDRSPERGAAKEPSLAPVSRIASASLSRADRIAAVQAKLAALAAVRGAAGRTTTAGEAVSQPLTLRPSVTVPVLSTSGPAASSRSQSRPGSGGSSTNVIASREDGSVIKHLSRSTSATRLATAAPAISSPRAAPSLQLASLADAQESSLGEATSPPGSRIAQMASLQKRVAALKAQRERSQKCTASESVASQAAASAPHSEGQASTSRAPAAAKAASTMGTVVALQKQVQALKAQRTQRRGDESHASASAAPAAGLGAVKPVATSASTLVTLTAADGPHSAVDASTCAPPSTVNAYQATPAASATNAHLPSAAAPTTACSHAATAVKDADARARRLCGVTDLSDAADPPSAAAPDESCSHAASAVIDAEGKAPVPSAAADVSDAVTILPGAAPLTPVREASRDESSDQAAAPCLRSASSERIQTPVPLVTRLTLDSLGIRAFMADETPRSKSPKSEEDRPPTAANVVSQAPRRRTQAPCRLSLFSRRAKVVTSAADALSSDGVDRTAKVEAEQVAASDALRKRKSAKVLVAHAFRPSVWNALSQRNIEHGSRVWDASAVQSRTLAAARDRQTSCTEGFLRGLANHHTLFAVLCQPRPAPGTDHLIDLEQLVQCFWCGLMTELAVVAALIVAKENGEVWRAQPAVLIADALGAATVAGAVALAGCRAVFVWSGPAGRSKLRSGEAIEPAPACCFKLCDCKCDPSSTAVRRRAERASVGWLCAVVVYMTASAVSIFFLVGSSWRTFSSLLAAWAVSQLLSWLLLEPIGVLVLVVSIAIVSGMTRGFRAQIQPSTVASSSPKPKRVRVRVLGAGSRAPKEKTRRSDRPTLMPRWSGQKYRVRPE